MILNTKLEKKMIVAFEMKLVCNYHEKEDPTGFENSDRNQESEEISCETDLVSNYENLEGIVRISEIAFGRIIINESYTEG